MLYIITRTGTRMVLKTIQYTQKKKKWILIIFVIFYLQYKNKTKKLFHWILFYIYKIIFQIKSRIKIDLIQILLFKNIDKFYLISIYCDIYNRNVRIKATLFYLNSKRNCLKSWHSLNIVEKKIKNPYFYSIKIVNIFSIKSKNSFKMPKLSLN